MSEENEAPRDQQLNLKASRDCKAIFLAIVKYLETSNAALFEDMVAERWEELERRGVRLEV